MKSPLSKRYMRDLRGDLGKYAVIFLLLMISIGFTSGYIVAGDSMIRSYNESFQKYNIEDGHFIVQNRLNQSKQKAISELDIRIYDLFFADLPADHGTVRVFGPREEINRVCLMEGAYPGTRSEIAIDRMYAENNGIGIGNRIHVGGKAYTVTGTVAMSDYSTMFQDNDDMMFDASLFGTAVVTEEEFRSLPGASYCYAWKYTSFDKASSEKEVSETLMKKLNKIVALEEFVPRYLNQAIIFTGDDMGGDRAMMEVFLYIITVITAFVYAITTRDTIEKEAGVIGTLRAMGYSRSELTRHYMRMPILITLVSAVVGNILGYTVIKGLCAYLYYHSYSLTKYHTIWSPEALLRTTLIPIILMTLVTWVIIRINLTRSPLQFLRHDLSRSRHRAAMPLPGKIPFFSRFRTRIILQNIPNYLMLGAGILFANLLLMFGLLLPVLMENYADSMTENMLAKYQYILSVPDEAMDEENATSSLIELMKFSREVSTETEGAEEFGTYTLKTIVKEKNRSDEIMIYGVNNNSRYVHQKIRPGEVYVSSLYQDKFRIRPGDKIRLKEPYDDDTYTFTVTGVYPYEGALCLFMGKKDLDRTFDLPGFFYAGYFSDRKITDIDEKYIGTVIDYEALTRVSRQLLISMGGFMKVIDGFSIILSLILIYLLSKIIIEKNTQSISMVKILGYSNREINKLYITATAIMVVVFVFLSLPICYKGLEVLWRLIVAMKMSGWIRVEVPVSIYVEIVLFCLVTFAVVAVLEMRKISRIPMGDALKNVE